MSFENNNDNNKKRGKKSLYNFLDKQGFYLILLLCVSIVLVTAVWVSRQEEKYFLSENSLENAEEDFDRVEVTLVEEEVQKEEDHKETANLGGSPKVIELIESQPREKTTSKNPLEEGNKNQEPQKEETAITTTADFQYIMIQPVTGKIGLTFAEDRLVYHKTLDQWSTHKGLDIHAEEGSPVRSVLDGEVIEVTNDTIMGITVGIKHEGDLITRYSNLSTDAMVKVGQRVKKGQVISGVGRTAVNKTLEGPLLHFQVIYQGKEVDPQKYLPKIN